MGDPLQKSIERHFTLIPYNPSAYVNFNDPAVESIRVFSNVSLGTVVGRVNASAVSTIEYYLTAFRSDHSDVVRWIDVDRNSGQLRIIRKPVDTDVDVEITAVSKGFTASKMVSLQPLCFHPRAVYGMLRRSCSDPFLQVDESSIKP